MPEQDRRPQVTIEDLLRLKRSERPAAEFWTTFERELRQKQLTALLEKRPWWRDLPQLLVRRAYLPVGATAILAFTLVSVKYYAPVQLAQVETASSDSPVAVNREIATRAAAVTSSSVNRSESAPALPDLASVAADDSPAGVSAAEPVELMPLLVAPGKAEKSNARLLAANLTRIEQPDAYFNSTAFDSRLSSSRATAAAPAVEELASVPTGENRRNRLLARYDGRQLNPEPAPPEVVRYRLARRLGDTDSSDRRLSREIDTFGTPMPQIVALRF